MQCNPCRQKRRWGFFFFISLPLKVLRNTGIALSRVNTGVLNTRIPARLHVPNNRLIIIHAIGTVSGHFTIVRIIIVVPT